MKKTPRKPLTKAMLLPLPAARVRFLSLEHHLALEVLCQGKGGRAQMVVLFRAVYLAYLLRDGDAADCSAKAFRDAEAALNLSTPKADGKWAIPATVVPVLKTILSLHDRQLVCVASHLYESACVRLQRFATGQAASPIPRIEVSADDGHRT